MKISLINCNGEFAKQLQGFGYEVSEGITPDTKALLYTGSLSDTLGRCKATSQSGVFVINTDGKTPEEIDNILQKRLYSPIFFS